MKLTKDILRRIINEELNGIMIEEGAIVPKGMTDALQQAHDHGYFDAKNKQKAERQLAGIFQDSLGIDSKMSGTIAKILMFNELAKRAIDGSIDSLRASTEARKLEKYFNKNVVAFVMSNIIPILQGLKSTSKGSAPAPTTLSGDDDMVFE